MYFQSYGLNNYFNLSILIFFYFIIILLGLIIVYHTKKSAFYVSHNYCYYRIIEHNKLNYIRNAGKLQNAMTIERERLAREIIAPLFNLEWYAGIYENIKMIDV